MIDNADEEPKREKMRSGSEEQRCLKDKRW